MSIDRGEGLGVGERVSPKRQMAELERKLNAKGPYREIGRGESFRPKGSFFEIALSTRKDADTVAVPNSGEVGYKRFICGLNKEGKPVALGVRGKMVPFKPSSSGVGLNLTFGRTKNADLPMVSPVISRKHGIVWWREDEGFSVIGLSSNPTYCREISGNDATEWLRWTQAMRKKGEGGGETKQEGKSEKRRREEREKSPLVTYERIVIDGRSEEDKTSVALEKTLRDNKWGINFIGGVFDGHSLEKTAGRLAQGALPIFWKHLKGTKGKDLSKAIQVAAAVADQEIINTPGFEGGTCAEIVITTSEGVYLVHVGDGQVFLQNGKGKIRSAGLPPHKPAGKGRVAGQLAVNRSWGDGEIKRKVSPKDLSPIPTIKFIEWDELRAQGETKLLVTTDGLLDLMKFAGDKGLVRRAFELGLGGKFERAVDEVKERFDVKYKKEIDDISALLLTFEF